ncbi:hypothetical protein JCM33374_g6512 [Metschnikowia sp. JCM 33374]|nr:hypothetical protein JCM33374_g6512 [Metschnikowia sp. JCM 33374]
MRHKTSSESFPEPSFVSEVKEIKRNRRRGSAGSSKPRDADTVDGKYSLMLSNQPMEEKASLFMASTARIVSYQENVHESPLRTSPGTLLAHGEFEIFQLHGGDVTYLACGKSFVYPLLPKLNILRTSAREFVLPLVNPQRYWKIHIDSTEDSVFVGLESVLKKVVKYTNMAIPAEAVSAPIKEAEFGSGPLEVASSDSPSHAGHVIEAPASPKNTPGSSKPSNYVPYFNDIPESPPSVPVSPQQVNLYKTPPTFPVNEESLSSWDSTKDTAENTYSITSAVASFGITNAPEPHENNPRATSLIHPRPHPLANRTNSLSNPFYQGKPGNSHISAGNKIIDRQRPAPEDTKSESSSMDSLLDEYEETISVTKSVQHNISRPVSRTPSHISAARSTALSAALQYTRLVVVPGHDYETNSRPLHRRNGAESSQIDGFPTASLSRYERARQDSADGRSRRSSVSELYSSTSNWMEPSQIAPVKKLASSKSTYSFSGQLA